MNRRIIAFCPRPQNCLNFFLWRLSRENYEITFNDKGQKSPNFVTQYYAMLFCYSYINVDIKTYKRC